MGVDTKLTDLATATHFDTASWFLLVDPTDTTMDDSGTDKKIQVPDLIAGLLPSQTGKADKVLATDGVGGLSWVAQTGGGGGGGSGTVTSVALTVPSWLNVSGSPVTTSGTLAITLDSGQSANRVLASPDGVTGAVAMRALVAADIPNLPAAQITSGTISTARLGTGTANSTKFLQGDQTWQTLNQAAVAGLATTDSPTFAGLTVGATSGLLKRTSGVLGTATSGTDYEPPITAGTTSQYLKGDKSLGTLNQAAVAGLTTASSPTFAGLTVGSLSGLLKAASGVVSAATAGTDYLTTSYAGTTSVTTLGTITTGTWTGTTIAVANGGTGQTTAALAINALLPTQTGHNGEFLTTNGTVASWAASAGSGTVTTLSVASANGLAGTVANPTTTPAITLSTTVTGLLKGNGTAISAATAWTDYAKLLVPTAPKTTTYTAAVGDFVPCDSTSGGFTVTLPTAPADQSLIGIKHTTQGSANTVTVACGGSDVFNRTSGPTTTSLSSLGRCVILQYKSSSAIWYVVARDLGTLLAADIPTIAATQVTAPGSDGQFLRNTSGALAGSTRLIAGSGNSINFVPTADPGSPVAGDLWVDSTQKSLSFLNAGVICRTGGVIWQGLSAGTALTNSTTQTSLLSGVATSLGTLTIPAGGLVPGKVVIFNLFGTVSSLNATTITFQVLLGSSVIGKATATTSAAVSGNVWAIASLEGSGWQVQSVGSSGVVIGGMRLHSPNVYTGVLNGTGSANGAPTGVTVDTTISNTLDFQVKWTSASASNSIQFLGGWIRIEG